MNVKRLIHNGWCFVGKNLPAFLTGIGLAGVVGTAFLAGKGALEADKKLKEYETKQQIKLAGKEKFKVVYKYYLPATIAGLGTAACIIGANRISAQQLAAMATVAKTAEKALRENRDKVNEVFGEKGLRKVDEKINESHADKFFSNAENIYDTGHGTTICCEGFLTGTVFRASPEWVHRCVNEFNHRLISGEQLCYNEFIQMLIPNFDEELLPDAGYTLGYNLDVRNHMLEIVEDSGLLKDTREPYLMINLREWPLIDKSTYYQDHMAYA